MEVLLALTAGALVAGSAYLMLSRGIVKFLFGLILLGNASNLVIFTAGRLTPGSPPLIDKGLSGLAEPAANALPQALILTAIVISFGLLAFALVLVSRAYQALGTTNTDEMRVAEPRRGAEDAP